MTYALYGRYRIKIEDPEIVDVIRYDDGVDYKPLCEAMRSSQETVAVFINISGDRKETFKKAEEWVRSMFGTSSNKEGTK